MSVTDKLKQELWKSFGDKDKPSEWDGTTYDGGKLSQRYWEYFRAVEYLELTPESVVLDIGGGSFFSNYPFFAMLIQPFVKEVILVDPGMTSEEKIKGKIKLYAENADYDSLKKIFSKHDITHVACVSVFEHIKPEFRNPIVKGINDFFKGDIFVSTLEYHPRYRWFSSQLTTRTLSDMVSHIDNFYLQDYSSSAVQSENAFKVFHRYILPRWYPVAMNFRRLKD